ncbi:MAG: DUF2500 domain-containing protein [Oscillospiraceae bacterium]|jgi:hypothetical protein|nr:DUF2500 domain-containing protein [Oscillospiraceae bacterium]
MSENVYEITVLIGGSILIVGYFVFRVKKYIVPFINRPEQQEQVIVFEKIKRPRPPRDTDDYDPYDYLVAFQFSDGAVKEFQIEHTKGHMKSDVYNLIHKGDQGLLIYIERKDIEEKIENEIMRWRGRRIVSFEKETPCGKIKFKSWTVKTGLIMVIGLAVLILSVLFSVVLN